MSAGTRFVQIPADRLLANLREVGAAVTAKGGQYRETTAGHEQVVDVIPPGSPVAVRVYTSLAVNAAEVRDCGDDAVRLVLVQAAGERQGRPLGESQRVFRTAPRAAGDRVGVFLERLRETIREHYRLALHWPACPKCSAAMAVRAPKAGGRKFLGCTAYPGCNGTRPYADPQS